jgi:hypothetical protein
MKFKNIKKNPPVGEKKKQFPSISRTIPAFAKISSAKSAFFPKFSLPEFNSVKLIKLYGKALKVFVVFVFMVTAIIVGYDFQRNLQIKQSIEIQRKVLTKDLSFWEDFIAKHQNYRDAYFQASVLEYKLGDIPKARTYVQKGLSLDPNSEKGRKIEQLLK